MSINRKVYYFGVAVGILETSTAKGVGIEELKSAIVEQVNNLPHVCDLLPKDEPTELKFNGVPAFEHAYPVLPSSVITRFIVRMNQKVENHFIWLTDLATVFTSRQWRWCVKDLTKEA